MTPPVGAARAVMTAGRDAIPASAILHYPYVERTNSTVTERLEGLDGTANGTTNVSGNYRDGYAEDGSAGDYIELTNWSTVNFGSKITSNWGIAFTFQTTSDPSSALGVYNGNWDFVIGINIGNTNAGKMNIRIRDRNGNDNINHIAGDVVVNDGNLHRAFFGMDGPSPEDCVVYIDGVDETVITRNEGSHNQSDDFSASVYANADNGLIYDNPILVDNIIVTSQKPTSTVAQDDYNKQPWS